MNTPLNSAYQRASSLLRRLTKGPGDEMPQPLWKRLADRPTVEAMIGYGLSLGRYPGVQPPRIPVTYTDLMWMARNEVVCATIIQNLRNEIFRQGVEVREKFSFKCTHCDMEFDRRPEDGVCSECGGELREPDALEREKLERVLRKANDNGQRLLEVLKMFEGYLDPCDDAYLICRKVYALDENGVVVPEETYVREVLAATPQVMRKVCDDKGLMGGKYYVCLIHRGESVENKPGRCRICGNLLYDVHYVSVPAGGGQAPEEYYVEGEVLHASKYNPSLIYGFSGLITCWYEALTLYYSSRRVKVEYEKPRTPNSILMIATKNLPSFRKWWEEQKQKLKADPYEPPVLAYEGDRKGAEVVNLARSLREVELLPIRTEFRQRISAFYGVSNIFMADTSASGGLNNEGLQILVTNRAVEFGQRIYNDIVFPWLLRQLGVDDYTFTLPPSEEEDMMAALQRADLRAATAQRMLAMGFSVRLKEPSEGEVLEFEFGGEAQRQPAGEEMPQGPTPSAPRLPPAEQTSGETGFGKEDDGIPLAKEFWSNALKAYREAVFKRVFEGLSKDQSDRVRQILLDAFEDGSAFDFNRTVEAVMKVGLDQLQAERIVRTEHQAVANKARELGFQRRDPEGKFRYRWSIKRDHRTSDICKEIAARVEREGGGGGVPLERMKEILVEVSKKHLGAGWEVRDWTPHINCRSTLVRVV